MVNISIPPTLLEKIDLLRGDVARSRFITKILQKALEEEKTVY